jgi:hypothetical protein
MPNAMSLADDDFAKRLIQTLLDRKLEQSIYYLCETLEPDFPNGIYHTHLIEIKTKIKSKLGAAQCNLTVEVAHTQQLQQEPTARKPFYSLLEPQNFDLTELIRDCVNELDDTPGLIGLAVPYEKREFPKYFCNRLKDRLGKKDIRILETTLKPQINSVDRVINQIKGQKNNLKKSDVICRILVENGNNSSRDNDLWREIVAEVTDDFEHRLIVIMFSSKDRNFPEPEGMIRLNPPKFTKADANDWILDLTRTLEWTEQGYQKWKKMMIDDCLSNDRLLDIEYVYDHLNASIEILKELEERHKDLKKKYVEEDFIEQLEQRIGV